MSYRAVREAITGPLVVIAINGRYIVIDRGNGSRVLAPKFRSAAAAQKWVDRQTVSRQSAQ